MHTLNRRGCVKLQYSSEVLGLKCTRSIFLNALKKNARERSSLVCMVKLKKMFPFSGKLQITSHNSIDE